MSTTGVGPAQRLVGALLPGEWVVIAELPKHPAATGGFFSQGYIVEPQGGGKRAFLKALDYADAARAPDPAMAIKAMTDAYVFERDLLKLCHDRRLDRVVSAIDGGKFGNSIAGLVLYLIFELADGDVRTQIYTAQNIDLAWRFRALHQIATGLKQLHSVGVAHQDLKPSNILIFHDSGSKLADLGRACSKGQAPPHEFCEIAGDRSYAPPELLYHYLSPDWNTRRLGCDAYLLGSMVVFFFGGVGMTQMLVAELAPVHRPHVWPGSYSDVLPYVRDAFGKAVAGFKSTVPTGARDRITAVVKELCEPDPLLRGHRKEHQSRRNAYSLERYITEFDLLARRVECGLIRNGIN